MVAPAFSTCGLSLRNAHSFSSGSVNPLSPAKAQQLIQIMRYGGDYDKIINNVL